MTLLFLDAELVRAATGAAPRDSERADYTSMYVSQKNRTPNYAIQKRVSSLIRPVYFITVIAFLTGFRFY